MVLIGIRQSLFLDSAPTVPFGHSYHGDVQHLHAWDLAVRERGVAGMVTPPTPLSTTPRDPDADRFFPRVNETMDRIVNQLTHKPAVTSLATIVVYTGLSGELKDGGKTKLRADGCPVTDCHFTDDVSAVATADAVLWQQGMMGHSIKRPANQIWVAFFLESPLNSQNLAMFDGQINWMATYRRDSALVTPYEKFVAFPNASLYNKLPAINYAANKTKLAAWFVSNCGAANGRLDYVSELQQHMEVTSLIGY
jgi:glycoprotein 3-alpha-L-fucosyltransferase